MNGSIGDMAARLGLVDISSSISKFSLTAAEEDWTYEHFLKAILADQEERDDLRSREAMLKFAGFPYQKTIQDFDFGFQKSISPTVIAELADLGWIKVKQNIVFLGPPGTGKTHLAIALGIEACKRRYRVRFTTCADLITKLKEAKERNTYSRRLASYTRSSLLIIDEVGFNPLNAFEAALLFDVICQRYEHGSVILTSNKSFTEWAEIFSGDAVIATALLDRLLHHSKSFSLKGDSFRMKEFRESKP